jgi:hypothetical protein
VLRFALPLVVACALAASASAAPVAGQVQPDSLPFGTLHTDGVAEANFMIFAPPDDPNPKIKVDAPKFVKVLTTGTHAQTFGKNGAFTCVSVEVVIDTAKAGEFKGEIAVTVGDAVTKVPVSATVKAHKAGTPRLLVAGTPFERCSIDDGKTYKAWTDVVDTAGLDVSYLLLRAKKDALRDLDLSKFDGVLMTAGALVFQTDEDVKRVRAFAEKGGRVLVTADAFFVGSVKGANAVLKDSGLEILNEEPPGMAQPLTLKKADFAEVVGKAGVESATFFRASPIAVQKGGRVLVNAPGYDKPGLGLAATAKVGKGEMTALGASLWWYWVSDGDKKGQANGSDNAKLLRYLLVPPRKG